jgi:signal transduction histidine kinase/CheY-like chemotaxis protein
MRSATIIPILILSCSFILTMMCVVGFFFGGIQVLLPVLFLIVPVFLLSLFLLYQVNLFLKKLQSAASVLSLEVTVTDTEASIVRKIVDEYTQQKFLVNELLPSAKDTMRDSKDAVDKIFSVLQSQFPVNAIVIQLFEDISGTSAKKYSIGFPQWMEEDEPDRNSDFVLQKTLSFGGKRFGKLMVESKVPFSEIRSSAEHMEIIAAYASIMLMNADFQLELSRIQSASDDTQQIKTGFLANLSHEIRGPLGVIMNSVELVLDGLCGDITEQGRDALRMVRESSSHLMDLVNDVLDYAKIESGTIETDPVSISLDDLLSDMSAVIRSQALQKGQKLIVEKPEEKNLAVRCDKRHARQILINVLTNAVKYTPEGGKIVISAHTLSSQKIKIAVEDTGVGIPEDEYHKVFGAFQRVDNEYSRMQQGTGLGMPLTKKLVEVNGGTVGFSSEEGIGSTFWIELPISFVTPLKTEEQDGTIIQFGNGEHILLVEPDDEQRNVYSKSLTQRGFVVTSVSSASEVLREFRTGTFSAVVIETDLPDSGGEELIQSIRSIPKGAKIPLIIMSGKAFIFDLEHFIRLGVDRCLSKPFSLAELSGTIRKLIDETVSLDEASQAEA